MKQRVVIFAVVMGSISNTYSQGAFQDLNFEEATVIPVQIGISATAAFPGWQTSISSVSLDGLSTGGAAISLINNDSSAGTTPLDGNYSAYLFGGGLAPNLFSALISQTGVVPLGTESIQLDASYFGAPFAVMVGGTTIDMVPLDTFVHYTLWGGNLPASMAGKTETLTIIEPPPTGTPPSGMELDDISFSPNPITVTPEPSPLALTAIGGILFALYRRLALKQR
jgi:hypothetical protein